MYDELVERLRFAVYEEDTDGIVRILEEAADAIEDLSMRLHGDEAAIAGMKREIERMVVAGKPNWIPVTERLPENQGPFLARYGFGDVSKETGQFFYGVLYYFYADAAPHWQHESAGIEVTHWMPLPEPPKEE